MQNEYDTIIIGGGQGGISTSYYLKENEISHLILEKSDKPAFAWREQRWDSFCFVIPNWCLRLPGGTYEDFNIPPDEFILRDDLVKFFEDYIEKYDLPVKYNQEVISATNGDGFWTVRTRNLVLKAKNIVVATGFFQTPKKFPSSNNLDPSIHQSIRFMPVSIETSMN